MTAIFDTHAHYDDDAFNEDREQLLAALPGQGIARVVDVGASLASCRKVLELMEQYDYIYGAIGVHPSETAELTEESYSWLKEQCQKEKCLAVGEIGLDYYWPEPDHETQKKWFLRQLDLAREIKKPVIIHSRDAAKDTVDLMTEAHAEEIGGVIHCYSYTKETAKIFLDMGFYFGIGGVALMTALANLLASGILVYRLMRTDGPLRLYPKRLFKMDKKALRSMIKIGWPAGLQSSVFSLSNLIIQSAINSLGADVMAASVAAFTIEINCYCVINGFGLAATTFISQNYGAGNLERCKRITRVNMALNIGITVVLSVLIYGFGRYLLGFFTQSEEIISLGMIRLLWVVIPEPLNSVMEVLSDSMRGYGYSLPPAIITVVVICTIRIVWVYSVFAAKPTYEILMMVYPLSWLVTSICLTFLYFRFMKQLPAKRCRTAVKK